MARATTEIRVDIAGECLWRDGERVALPPKAFAVLRRLMEQPDQLVTKEALLDSVWPETYVIDKVLNLAILQLRQAFGDDAKQSRYIETVHRRGFRWIGPQRLSSTVEAPSAATPACIGRNDPLNHLAACFQKALTRTRQVVFVTGDPGIGKTTLVDAFLDTCSGVLLTRGQCVDSYRSGEPYRPIFDAVEALWDEGDKTVRAIIRNHMPTWLLQMPSLSSPAELKELRRNVAVSTSKHMEREIERALITLSTHRPVILFLEDLHWSDPATVGLLWSLAARRDPARLLVIGTYRPIDAIAQEHPITRLRHELVAKRLCTELALDGLDREGVRDYLAQRFGAHELPVEFATQIHAQTSGNPLFLSNALEHFEQRGWLREQDGAWRCSADVETLNAAVAEGTRDIVGFRLDQLSASSQQILEAASVVGMDFATQTVAAVLDLDCSEVEDECAKLTRTTFLSRGGGDIRWPDGSHGRQHQFRHALYRQILYQRVSPSRRQHLHRRIAERLEHGHGAGVRDILAQASVHYEQAGDLSTAVERIETLVQEADARRATPEVESLLGRAIGLVKRLPESEEQRRRLLRLTVGHAISLVSLRGVLKSDHVAGVFEEARLLATTISATPEDIAALSFAAATDLLSGRLHDACSATEQQLALCGDQSSPLILVNANLGNGLARLYRGEVESALERFQAAADLLEKSGLVIEGYDPNVPLRMGIGLAHVVSGRGAHGWSIATSGVEYARRTNLPAYIGPALSQAVGIALLRDDRAMARELVTELLELCAASGLPLWFEAAKVQQAWLDMVEQRDPAQIEALRGAIDDFYTGPRLGIPRMFAMLADANLLVGRVDDASAALDRAFDTRGEECLFDAELLRKRAEILLARAMADPSGQHREQAEQVLERAIDVAATQGAHLFQLRAHIDLYHLLCTTGHKQEAHSRLQEYIAGFTDAPDEPDLCRARDLLN